MIELSTEKPAAEPGVRKPGRGTVLGLVVGVVVGVIGTLAVTHGGGTSTAAAVPSGRSAAPAPSTAPRLSPTRLLAIADQPFGDEAARSEGMVTEQASLLSWPTDGQDNPRGLHDEGDIGAPPGAYTMTVYCAGDGRVVASVRVGSATGQRVVDCTTKFARAAPVSVTTADGGSYEVTITALDGGTSAVSYQLRPGG